MFSRRVERVHRVVTKVIPGEDIVAGRTSFPHEVRAEVQGVRLGERPTPPSMRGAPVKEGIPQKKLPEYAGPCPPAGDRDWPPSGVIPPWKEKKDESDCVLE
jgi:hypothetical protein